MAFFVLFSDAVILSKVTGILLNLWVKRINNFTSSCEEKLNFIIVSPFIVSILWMIIDEGLLVRSWSTQLVFFVLMTFSMDDFGQGLSE